MLIEEYRHGVERLSVELPCGTPEDEGEDVLEAMQRELLEETGYGSEEWHSLGSSTANTARQNNRVHAFLALDAHKVSDQKLDPGEMIRAHVVPWQKFVDDLADGRLEIPGLHLAALWQLRVFAGKHAIRACSLWPLSCRARSWSSGPRASRPPHEPRAGGTPAVRKSMTGRATGVAGEIRAAARNVFGKKSSFYG